jgi:hypothetical protein
LSYRANDFLTAAPQTATNLDDLAADQKKGDLPVALSASNSRVAYSAAIRTSGAAARTSASTSFSNCTKFFWNIPTSLRAV